MPQAAEWTEPASAEQREGWGEVEGQAGREEETLGGEEMGGRGVET